MKHIALTAALLVSAAALGGCVEQKDADVKMTKGCEAAVTAMIAPNTIKEIKGTTAEAEKTMGSVYRRIKITYTENEDFAEMDKEGTCLFSEQWGMFKGSHAALLEQVTYHDTIIGKKDGNIQGDMNDFLKLTEAVDTAMGQQ